MPTLLLVLSGPQQAWGSRSRFATRATELAPTKSGVIGLLAAALGMERTAPLDRFGKIRFGVRIDQPGTVERDFQTTRSLDGKSFPLSHRFYLADAVFLVGIEAERGELLAYQAALTQPYFPLFLGRRAFPPDGPVRTALVASPLRQALSEWKWEAKPSHQRTIRRAEVSLELVLDLEGDEVSGETRQDVPESFDPRRRRHGFRDVTMITTTMPHPDPPGPRASDGPPPRGGAMTRSAELLGSPTEHDPEALLTDEEL